MTVQRQTAAMQEKGQELDAEIEHYRAVTTNLRRGMLIQMSHHSLVSKMSLERDKERSTLNTHLSSILPELEECQRYLHCTIEGLENQTHLILVLFDGLDDSKAEREFRFVIDISEKTYKSEFVFWFPV
jgi:kinetochore protein Spc25, fungi type